MASYPSIQMTSYCMRYVPSMYTNKALIYSIYLFLRVSSYQVPYLTYRLISFLSNQKIYIYVYACAYNWKSHRKKLINSRRLLFLSFLKLVIEIKYCTVRNLHMRVCAYIYSYIYVHIYIYVYICMCMEVCMYVCNANCIMNVK